MTSPTIENTTRYSFNASLQGRTLRNAADKFEKDAVILELQHAILNPDAPLDWDAHEIDLKPGSSLY